MGRPTALLHSPPAPRPGPALFGAAVAVSIPATLVIATRGTWDRGLPIVAAATMVMIFLWRPLVLIATLLLPFLVLDERTGDAIPAFTGISDALFGYAAVGCVAIAALAAHAAFPPVQTRGRPVTPMATAVLGAAGACILLSLILGAHAPGPSARALIPFVNAVGAAYVAWRLIRAFDVGRAERGLRVVALALGAILSAIGLARVVGLVDAVWLGVPITFYDSASPYLLLACALVAALAAARTATLRSRLVYGLAASSFVVVSLASQRRGVIVGYVVAVLLLLAIGVATRRLRFSRLVGALIVTVALATISLAALGQVIPGAQGVLDARFDSALAALGDDTTENAVTYRVQESATVARLAGEHIVLGIGPETVYRASDATYVPDGRYIHNTYLMLPLRYGLLGILSATVLVAGLIAAVAAGIRAGAPPAAWGLGAGLIALLPAIATAAFLTHTTRWPIIVGLFAGAFDGLARAGGARPPRRAPRAAIRSAPEPPPQWRSPLGSRAPIARGAAPPSPEPPKPVAPPRLSGATGGDGVGGPWPTMRTAVRALRTFARLILLLVARSTIRRGRPPRRRRR